MTETTHNEGSPATDGSPVPRFFLALKSYGLADSKGKTLMGIEMSTKRILAEPDAPMALMVALMEQFVDSWQYSSPDACERDIQRLRSFVDDLEVK